MILNKQVKNQISKNRSNASVKKEIQYFFMILPGVLLFLIFNYLPMFGVVIAFKNFNPNLGIFKSDWVGLSNFEFFFCSQDAVRIIRNTLAYSVAFLILGLICSVSLALMFYYLKSSKMLKVYNTIIILPKFMSMVIIAFLVYTILNPASGLLNQLIVLLGGKGIEWYSEPKYWPFILIFVHIWQTVGMSSVIYYASLMGMDDSLLEASTVDGANRWHQIIHIVIPHLVPLMVISTILAIGHLFSGDFGLFYQVPQDIGLLYPTTDIINTYTFRALQNGALAKSTAVGLFQSVVGLILVVVTNAIVRKISPENSLF